MSGTCLRSPVAASGLSPPGTLPESAHAALHDVTRRIKARMQAEGAALIGFQAINGLPNFFRAVFPSADAITDADLDGILADIERIGDELATNGHA